MAQKRPKGSKRAVKKKRNLNEGAVNTERVRGKSQTPAKDLETLKPPKETIPEDKESPQRKGINIKLDGEAFITIHPDPSGQKGATITVDFGHPNANVGYVGNQNNQAYYGEAYPNLQPQSYYSGNYYNGAGGYPGYSGYGYGTVCCSPMGGAGMYGERAEYQQPLRYNAFGYDPNACNYSAPSCSYGGYSRR